MELLKNFIGARSGNFAIIVAICAPVLFGMGGLATDYALLYNKRAELQNVADAAALASAEELVVSTATASQVQSAAEEFVLANFYTTKANVTKSAALSINAKMLTGERGVKVDLSYEWAPFFAQLFDPGVTPIVVSATANLAGKGLTCVIGLMPQQRTAKSTIHLEDNANLRADNCDVYSNSTHARGIRLDPGAHIEANTICTAGGVWFRSTTSSASPKPIEDCPLIQDPLKSRPGPVVGNCDEINLVVGTDATLRPGTYCGGLRIQGNANVKFQPGVYIIKDGEFLVTDAASVQGEEVGFYLAGINSVFSFDPDTSISLTAPLSGPLAGLLFMEDKNVPFNFNFDPWDLLNLPIDVRLHRISSNNAHYLLGAIYVPKSLLLVDATQPVADASPWTAAIVGRLWLKAGPTLVLNADYSKTEVPVPNGLLSIRPVLTK
ncbi:MAG: TadE/TadG family type IV pilus assembly protein [Nitratireductor sp.]